MKCKGKECFYYWQNEVDKAPRCQYDYNDGKEPCKEETNYGTESNKIY